MVTRSIFIFGSATAILAASVSAILAGGPVPAPAAGLLGVPGWIALGAGYAGVLLVRHLRHRK